MFGKGKADSATGKKPIFKKWWFWVIIVVILLALFGGGGSGSKKEDVAVSTTEAPAAEEEPKEEKSVEETEEEKTETSTNPLMNCEVKEADVKSGSGDVIGTRAFIEIPAEELETLTNEQIAEFAINVVDGADYNYFTVDFGTGKGITFTGCNIEVAEIGELDELGRVVNPEKYLFVSKDGTVKVEDYEAEDAVEANDNTATDVEESSKQEENVPTEYKNALKKAEQYSSMMHMSKQGIYDQLTSEYGEQFPADAAQYAVDNMTADWNANALEKAEDYSETMHMSKQGIYDQLISEYGEKFTAEEAQYAVDNMVADWNANALEKAKDYQQTMSMSSSAIYDQLVSEYGEKFTAEEAQYAIDHLE